MKKVFALTSCLFAFGLGMLSVTRADEIVMRSGERFTSSEIWEETGKIRFNMQGLVVSVNKEDVADIIRDQSPTKSVSSGKAMSATDSRYRPQEAPPASTARRGPSGPNNDRLNSKYDRNSANRPMKGNGIGISGLTWRIAPKQMEDLEKVKTDPAYGGIDQYWQPSRPLAFIGTPLDGLVYGFWQNQLYSVMMWVDGRIGYDRLKQTIFQYYGRGSQNDPSLERFVWDGAETQRMLEFDSRLNTGIFVMRSTVLDTQIKSQHPGSRQN